MFLAQICWTVLNWPERIDRPIPRRRPCCIEEYARHSNGAPEEGHYADIQGEWIEGNDRCKSESGQLSQVTFNLSTSSYEPFRKPETLHSMSIAILTIPPPSFSKTFQPVLASVYRWYLQQKKFSSGQHQCIMMLMFQAI